MISTQYVDRMKEHPNEHPIDFLPAFVLGALDADEAIRVADHLRVCASCRAEAEKFRSVVGLLPYATRSQAPPAHIKRQLMARVDATTERSSSESAVAQFRKRRRWPFNSMGLMQLVTASSLALAIGFGAMMAEAQERLANLQQNLAIVAFITDPRTVDRSLAAQNVPVNARMYMQSGHNRLVFVLHGLPAPAPGKTYQFWLATDDQPVPLETFTVGKDGVAEMLIDAPAPVDGYTEVMVTVEEEGGGRTPSENVVVTASL
jgi:anti-sigma-K factor RskA